jgi:hypothetical protein
MQNFINPTLSNALKTSHGYHVTIPNGRELESTTLGCSLVECCSY